MFNFDVTIQWSVENLSDNSFSTFYRSLSLLHLFSLVRSEPRMRVLVSSTFPVTVQDQDTVLRVRSGTSGTEWNRFGRRG